MNSSINNFQSTKRTAPRFNSEMKAARHNKQKDLQVTRRTQRSNSSINKRISAVLQGDH